MMATRFSIEGFDTAHYQTTEQYARLVDELFSRATVEITNAAAKGTYNPDIPFSFADYPALNGLVQKVGNQLAAKVQAAIEQGSRNQWLFACKKNDGFINSVFETSKLPKAQLRKMQDRNLDALSSFQGRKVDGMNLSQRVWRTIGQYKVQLESALDVGLGEGRSAQQLARDVKQNLREPNRLFRRVRDKRGNLHLSKAAQAYHPGRGVYRSSVKNAQRLTRTEINMAYRESDWARWQSLDFVVGFEVRRSNHEPKCKCDLCERLVGRYPKTFKFTGWHPQCMCHAIPILMDEETFDQNELAELKTALHGKEYQKQAAKNEVTDVPDGFKEWVTDHVEAQKGWASTPYFIKDNFVDGQLGKGLKIAMPTTHEIQSSLMADVAARLETMRKRRKEIKQQAQNIATTTISLSMFNTSIQISKGAVKEWLNQPHKFMLEKNELILDINKTLKQSKYVGWVKDKHNPNAKAHLFEIKINGEKSWIIVREFEDGTVCLHSITDSDKLAVMAKK